MKKRKGLTIIELLLSLALIGMIITSGASMIIFGIKSHAKTTGEFDVQSNIRIASQKINTTIKDSVGVFVLFRENANNLTDEWNYIMLNPSKTELLEYTWDDISKTHKVNKIFTSLDGVTLNITYNKKNASNEDRLLEYTLKVNANGKERIIQTDVEGINSLQVVDRAFGNQANTLAYRNDTKLSEVSNSQAAVALVLDKSGSMRYPLDRSTGNMLPVNDSNNRMSKLKVEATRLVKELSKQPNINISITPFSSTANQSNVMMKAQVNNTANTGLLNIINGLIPDGGTNTGDGIRRGYHRIKEFNENSENINKTNKNFMIILVDGVTTYASVHENLTSHNISFSSNQGTNILRNGKTYTYSHRTGFIWYNYYYSYTGPVFRDFVFGDNNIADSKADDNTNYPNGRYVGNGSLIEPMGEEYIELLGRDMVRAYKKGTNEAIKVYVIGFSAVPADHGSLQDIAQATTGDTLYYKAGSSEALEEIFRAIQRDITDALWHIGGPN